MVPKVEMLDKFQTVFELFASCHKIYDQKKVDTNDIALLSRLN